MSAEKRDNKVLELSFNLAVRIVKFYKYIVQKEKIYDIARQVLRSGTSIGANVRESIHAQSEADFVSKLSIALKEADETEYWLELLFATDYIDEKMFESLSTDTKYIIGTLVNIIKTKKQLS